MLVKCWSRRFLPRYKNGSDNSQRNTYGYQCDRKTTFLLSCFSVENWLETGIEMFGKLININSEQILELFNCFLLCYYFFIFIIFHLFCFFWFYLDLDYLSSEHVRFFFTLMLRYILLSFILVLGFYEHIRIGCRSNFFRFSAFNLRIIGWYFVHRHVCLIAKLSTSVFCQIFLIQFKGTLI